MININVSGRLIDAIYALVTSMTAEAPETAAEAPEAAAAKDTKPVVAGRGRKKVAPREHEAVTRAGAPVAEPVEARVEPIKADEASPGPIKADEARPEPIKPAVTLARAIRALETSAEELEVADAPAPKAPTPVALDDEWPATLTKPSSWDYDEHGASWRAANQIGTVELGAALQRVYVDHADIIKMPSVRVAMSKLGVEGWWRCVAKNIAEARDASNRPLDITPKREA